MESGELDFLVADASELCQRSLEVAGEGIADGDWDAEGRLGGLAAWPEGLPRSRVALARSQGLLGRGSAIWPATGRLAEANRAQEVAPRAHASRASSGISRRRFIGVEHLTARAFDAFVA